MGLLEGFGVTLKQIGNVVTVPYDKDGGAKRPKPERFHGRHVLNRYEDGMEKCIGCELCAGVCPAKCIYVRGKDNPPDAPVSPGERFGFVYEINYLRCIHCDLCVEACPTEAITESKLFGDGKGWIAHVTAQNVILIKTFPDIMQSQAAMGEAEIEIYASAPAKNYVEVENQGAISDIPAGGTLSWTVRWYLRTLPSTVMATPGNEALVSFVTQTIQ